MQTNHGRGPARRLSALPGVTIPRAAAETLADALRRDYRDARAAARLMANPRAARAAAKERATLARRMLDTILSATPSVRALPASLYTSTVVARVAAALRSREGASDAEGLARLALMALGYEPGTYLEDCDVWAQCVRSVRRELSESDSARHIVPSSVTRS